jgi:hypothetical protein
MRTRSLVSITFASLMMLAAGEANAGLFRTYLSLNGSDANPCTLPQPCRLLPAALAAVNDGGEIWMLDSANFNTTTVSINKSLTILAVPGALGSVVANGADAISINTAGAKVTLRNLVILNLSGSTNNGIAFAQGAGLTVEGCELYGLNNAMLLTSAGSVVTIKDTTIRDNTNFGVGIIGTVKAQLRNVAVLNNGNGVVAAQGATAGIAGSAISGNTTGVGANALGGMTAQVAISGSTISGNSTGLGVVVATGADTAQAMINKTMFSQNGTGVNITGGTATVFSLGNNAFKFNTSDIGTGSLTALAAQ